jgi:outer membrane protein TolC
MPFFIRPWTPLGVPQKFVRSATAAIFAATLFAADFSALAQTGQTQGQPPLTLEAALQAAQKRSQALPAQDAAATAAREQALAAGRLPDPMLRLSVDNLPVDGAKRFSLTEDFMTMRSVGLTQTFTREGKRRARSASFERQADTALATREMELAKLRRNTALAWFELYFQHQLVDLLSAQRAEAKRQIASADAAYRAGSGSQADVFLARSAAARMDDRIRQAQAQRSNANTELSRWVGDVAAESLGAPPSISQPRLTAHMQKAPLDQYPDIAMLISKEAQAKAAAEVARQDKQADWSVSLMYGQRGPSFSNMASVVLSVPLQWDQANRQDRELAAKLAKVEQARAEREEMTRARKAQVQRWLESWRSGVERMKDYDASLIPLTIDRSTAALAAYSGGKASLSSVIDARLSEVDTRLEKLRIEMQTAALWVELEYLMPEHSAASNATAMKPNSRLGTQP